MKKVTALLLAAVMVLSLTACSTGSEAAATAAQETTAATTTSAAAKTAETAAAAAAAEEIPQWKVEHPGWLSGEKVNLSVLTYDGVNSNYLPPSNDLRFWQWMEDYTNVHIDWEVLSYTGYTDIISARLAGGDDLADIVMVLEPDIASDAGQNGILANLSNYWDECFTKTQAYFDEVGVDYKGVVTSPSGDCYAISTVSSLVENHIIFLYNKLWMDELGAKVPTTLDEFTALLEKMQAAGDLNHNGEADEIILSAADIDHVRTALNTTFDMEQWQDEDAFSADANGVVYDQYTSDNMKAELKYINGLYKKNLLDQEICSMSYDALSEKVASDRVGVYACYSSFAITYGKLTTAGQTDPTGEWYTLGVPLSSEWVREPYLVMSENYSFNVTGINAKSEKIELAAKWLDTLFADEKALEVRTLGYEGETFRYTDDKGNFEIIPPADGSSWSMIKLGGGQIALPYIQTTSQLMASKQSTPWYLEQYAHIRNDFEWRPHTITPVITFTEDEQEIRSTYRTDVQTGWKEYRDKFITGQLDVDKDWDTFVNTLNALGLQEMIKCYQSIYDRTK